MGQVVNKHDLSESQKRLLELMQQINFGRIEELAVRNGEPFFDPAPRVIREIKFGGENGPRHELGVNDFALKSQVVELFEQLCQIKEGTVECLEIKHGLPFRMNLVELVRV
ncbi:MAG: hypothetical protein HZA78_03085 [Candidatus Schekmanbacteria bacterium]|nr:hypothetical protein [Candidatus Schekmanbacteria bacterium]